MNNKWLSIILFSGIFSLIGFIFFLIGLLMFRHINKKEKRCILKTYGIVKDVVKHSGVKGMPPLFLLNLKRLNQHADIVQERVG